MKAQNHLNNNILGPTKKYPVPITLDPAYYKDCVVYGEDNSLRISDGTKWNKIWTGAVDLGTMEDTV